MVCGLPGQTLRKWLHLMFISTLLPWNVLSNCWYQNLCTINNICCHYSISQWVHGIDFWFSLSLVWIFWENCEHVAHTVDFFGIFEPKFNVNKLTTERESDIINVQSWQYFILPTDALKCYHSCWQFLCRCNGSYCFIITVTSLMVHAVEAIQGNAMRDCVKA